MKPWAERSAGERAGMVVGIGAAVLAAIFGLWKVGPGSAPPATETASGQQADAAAEPAPAADAAPAEQATDAQAGTGAADTAAAAPEASAEASPETASEAAETSAEGVTDAATAEPAPDVTPDATTAEPEATAEAAPEAPAATGQTETAPEPATDAAPAVPEFDLVRVTQDGSAVLAGSGAPGATMILRLDGAEIGTVPADAQGNFVALFNLAPSETPRVLTLAMRLADGTEIAAPGRVVISPTVAPEAPVVAEAEGAGEAAEPATAPTEPVPQAPAALLVTDEGARVLQSAQELSPAMAANVTVDSITYTPEGDVQFAGRGTGGAIVRLYLDNAQIADAVTDPSGAWSLTMPGIEPGLYTLRVDQIDAEGKVTSRFETPFQRETVEALAAAAAAEQSATADGAEAEAASGQSDQAQTDPAVASSGDAAKPVSVTVQPGFTLWRIARENLGDGVLYVQVFEANKGQIRDPDLIYPGQVFSIPSGE